MPDDKAIWAHGLANVSTFFAEVERAFAFLTGTFHFALAETTSTLHEARPTDTLDTILDAQAVVVYLSDHIEVDIVWGFHLATIHIAFIEVQTPGERPARWHLWDKEYPNSARGIRLDSLAAVRGHEDDPDFLLGNLDRVDGRSINRRFKLLQTNLTGVVDGLARATERYASDILRGDTSVFPEVMAYYTEERRARGFWVGAE